VAFWQLQSAPHRRRLHGGDGGDRPHGKKVVGAMPPSRPHKNFDRLISKVHRWSNFDCLSGVTGWTMAASGASFRLSHSQPPRYLSAVPKSLNTSGIWSHAAPSGDCPRSCFACLTHTASFGRSDTGSEIKYCLDDHYIKPLAVMLTRTWPARPKPRPRPRTWPIW